MSLRGYSSTCLSSGRDSLTPCTAEPLVQLIISCHGNLISPACKKMADTKNKDESQRRFDFTHWYYCSLWWRQYLYWQSHLARSQPASNQPLYPPPFYPPQVVGGAGGPSITLQLRFTTGEDCISSLSVQLCKGTET